MIKTIRIVLCIFPIFTCMVRAQPPVPGVLDTTRPPPSAQAGAADSVVTYEIIPDEEMEIDPEDTVRLVDSTQSPADTPLVQQSNLFAGALANSPGQVCISCNTSPAYGSEVPADFIIGRNYLLTESRQYLLLSDQLFFFQKSISKRFRIGISGGPAQEPGFQYSSGYVDYGVQNLRGRIEDQTGAPHASLYSFG